MQKAVIYARVSSKIQAEEGLSINAQINQLHDYAAKEGYEIVKEYIDRGKSAKTSDRPAFQDMISTIKATPENYDAVLIHKTDRFARNREDSIVYKSLLRRNCNVDIIAIKEDFGDGPVAKMIEGILEVIAEFYSENLAREVQKGQREKAKKGEALGEPPYGYIIGDDGKFKIYQPEAKIVKYIFRKYLEGNGSHTIGNKIKDIGIKKFGKAAIKKSSGRRLNWSSNRMVLHILKNNVYAGVFKWDDITIENNHPAIISKEDFEMAQELRSKKRGKGCRKRNIYLLKDILKCYECGGTLGRKTYKTKNKTVGVSNCINHRVNKNCYSNRNKMRNLEKNVINSLEAVSKELIKIDDLHLARVNKDQTKKKLELLKKKSNEFDKQFDRQMEAYQAEIINMEQLKKYKNKLEEEKQEVKRRISKLKNIRTDINQDKFKNRISKVVETLKDGNINTNKKRIALFSVIKEIRASRKKKLIEIVYKW